MPTTEGLGALSVRVSYEPDDMPAAGLPITCQYDGVETWQDLITDADGECMVTDLPATSVLVAVPQGATATGRVSPGRTTSVTLAIPRGNDLHGIVVSGAGAPVSAATVWLIPTAGVEYILEAAHCDASGRFQIRAVPDGYRVLARAPGLQPSIPTLVLPTERHDQLVLTLLGPAVALRGVVVDRSDRPIAGAFVFVGSKLPAVTHGARTPPPAITVTTNGKGEFDVDGLVPGEAQPVWVSRSGFALQRTIAPASTGDSELRIVLEQECSLAVRVQTPGARAVDGALVQYTPDGWPAAIVFDGPFWAQDIHATDPAGNVTLLQLPSGRGNVRVWTSTCSTTVDLELAPEQVNRATVVLDAAEASHATTVSLSGLVRDASGAPAQKCWISVSPVDGCPPSSAVTDARGRWIADRSCVEGAHLSVFDQLADWPFAVVTVTLADSSSATDLSLPYSRPMARIAGRTRTDAGLSHVSLIVDREGVQRRVDCALGADGTFLAGSLPPGGYAIQIEANGCRRTDLGYADLLPGSVHELGLVALEPAGSTCGLRVLVAGPDEGYGVVVMRDSGSFAGVAAVSNGETSFPSLTPGRYLAGIWNAEMALVSEPVELVPGAMTSCQLETRSGIPVTLRPDGALADTQRFRMEWRSESGALLWVDEARRWSRADLEDWVVRLVPGVYLLTVSTLDRGQETTRLQVGAGPALELPVRIP